VKNHLTVEMKAQAVNLRMNI